MYSFSKKETLIILGLFVFVFLLGWAGFALLTAPEVKGEAITTCQDEVDAFGSKGCNYCPFGQNCCCYNNCVYYDDHRRCCDDACSVCGSCPECSKDSDCPCPKDTPCVDGKYEDYPAYGECVGGGMCSDGTHSGAPCYPTTTSCGDEPEPECSSGDTTSTSCGCPGDCCGEKEKECVGGEWESSWGDCDTEGDSCGFGGSGTCNRNGVCVGETGGEDCCTAHESPRCEDDACTDCVCTIDRGCCEEEYGWDAECVSIAYSECARSGDCPCTETKGDCCSLHSEPGCDDTDCEDCICEIQPDCCDDSWEQSCINIMWWACIENCPCTCSRDSDCDCPEDFCLSGAYVDYPRYGKCRADNTCDTRIFSGQPCKSTIYQDDDRCTTHLSGTVTLDRSEIVVGESITTTVTGYDDVGVSSLCVSRYKGLISPENSDWEECHNCSGTPTSCSHDFFTSAHSSEGQYWYMALISGTTDSSPDIVWTPPSSPLWVCVENQGALCPNDNPDASCGTINCVGWCTIETDPVRTETTTCGSGQCTGERKRHCMNSGWWSSWGDCDTKGLNVCGECCKCSWDYNPEETLDEDYTDKCDEDCSNEGKRDTDCRIYDTDVSECDGLHDCVSTRSECEDHGFYDDESAGTPCGPSDRCGTCDGEGNCIDRPCCDPRYGQACPTTDTKVSCGVVQCDGDCQIDTTRTSSDVCGSGDCAGAKEATCKSTGYWDWGSCVGPTSACGTSSCPGDYCFDETYLCTYADDYCQRYCDGAGDCSSCYCQESCHSCGTTDCHSNYCSTDKTAYYSYPATCTNACEAKTGDDRCGTTCTCTATISTCSVGTDNECCQIACSDTAGCYTTAGACPDVCGATTLTINRTCSGCGANGATGTCGGGTSYTCNATTHTECQSRTCKGTTYYCTQDGGTWQWRTVSNPDRCGDPPNLDDCYPYSNGCEIRDYFCSAGSCTSTYSNRHTDSAYSYNSCPNICTRAGTYTNYYCSGASCVSSSAAAPAAYCNSNYYCSAGTCYAGKCGTKDCDANNYYYQTGTESPAGTEICKYRNFEDKVQYCDGAGDCLGECDPNAYSETTTYSCGTCQYISDTSCTSITKGACSNYSSAAVCGTKTENFPDYCLNKRFYEYDISSPYCDQETHSFSCDKKCHGAKGECLNCDLNPSVTSRCCLGLCQAECDATDVMACICPSNTCSGDKHYDYPDYGVCTNTCTCNTSTASEGGCQPSVTTCSASGCCVSKCSATTGCYTTAGTCPDVCGATTLTVNRTCSGCGANGATGTCGGGTSYTCNATTHTECQSRTCKGTTYYCTQDGGTWQWRTVSNPDRCGDPPNLDDCYPYSNGCEVRDYFCSGDACTSTYSGRQVDSAYSYNSCSNVCTRTGTYTNYYCSGASCVSSSAAAPAAYCNSNYYCSAGTCYAGKCDTKTQKFDDTCSAKKLVEYDNDCVQDSTTVSCDKYCDGAGVCADCDIVEPSTLTHCCQGVCGAKCDEDKDCPCNQTSTCLGADYYKYPDHGDCDSYCVCNTSTAFDQPCVPERIVNAPQCDAEPPCLNITSHASGQTDYSKTGTFTMSGTAHDAASGLQLNVVVWQSSGAYEQAGTIPVAADNTWSKQWTDLPEGQSTIYISAYDNAVPVPNFAGWNWYVIWIVDKTEPDPPTFAPETRAWSSDDVEVKVTYVDNLSDIEETKYCWTTASTCLPETSFSNNGTISQSGTGAWTLCTKARDKAGNWSSTHCSPQDVNKQGAYKIDKTPPTGSVSFTTSSAEGEIIIKASGSDLESGMKSLKLRCKEDTEEGTQDWLPYCEGVPTVHTCEGNPSTCEHEWPPLHDYHFRYSPVDPMVEGVDAVNNATRWESGSDAVCTWGVCCDVEKDDEGRISGGNPKPTSSACETSTEYSCLEDPNPDYPTGCGMDPGKTSSTRYCNGWETSTCTGDVLYAGDVEDPAWAYWEKILGAQCNPMEKCTVKTEEVLPDWCYCNYCEYDKTCDTQPPKVTIKKAEQDSKEKDWYKAGDLRVFVTDEDMPAGKEGEDNVGLDLNLCQWAAQNMLSVDRACGDKRQETFTVSLGPSEECKKCDCKAEGKDACEVTAYATDKNEQISSAEQSYSTDFTPPYVEKVEVKDGSKAWYNENITLNVTYSDEKEDVEGTSGLKECYYKIETYDHGIRWWPKAEKWHRATADQIAVIENWIAQTSEATVETVAHWKKESIKAAREWTPNLVSKVGGWSKSKLKAITSAFGKIPLPDLEVLAFLLPTFEAEAEGNGYWSVRAMWTWHLPTVEAVTKTPAWILDKVKDAFEGLSLSRLTQIKEDQEGWTMWSSRKLWELSQPEWGELGESVTKAIRELSCSELKYVYGAPIAVLVGMPVLMARAGGRAGVMAIKAMNWDTLEKVWKDFHKLPLGRLESIQNDIGEWDLEVILFVQQWDMPTLQDIWSAANNVGEFTWSVLTTIGRGFRKVPWGKLGKAARWVGAWTENEFTAAYEAYKVLDAGERRMVVEAGYLYLAYRYEDFRGLATGVMMVRTAEALQQISDEDIDGVLEAIEVLGVSGARTLGGLTWKVLVGIKDLTLGVLGKIWDWAKDPSFPNFGSLFSAIGNFFKTIVSALIELPGRVIGYIKNLDATDFDIVEVGRGIKNWTLPTLEKVWNIFDRLAWVETGRGKIDCQNLTEITKSIPIPIVPSKKIPGTGPLAEGCLSDGKNVCRVTFWAEDEAGNVLEEEKGHVEKFSIDWTTPSIFIAEPKEGDWRGRDFTVEIFEYDVKSSQCMTKLKEKLAEFLATEKAQNAEPGSPLWYLPTFINLISEPNRSTARSLWNSLYWTGTYAIAKIYPYKEAQPILQRILLVKRIIEGAKEGLSMLSHCGGFLGIGGAEDCFYKVFTATGESEMSRACQAFGTGSLNVTCDTPGKNACKIVVWTEGDAAGNGPIYEEVNVSIDLEAPESCFDANCDKTTLPSHGGTKSYTQGNVPVGYFEVPVFDKDYPNPYGIEGEDNSGVNERKCFKEVFWRKGIGFEWEKAPQKHSQRECGSRTIPGSFKIRQELCPKPGFDTCKVKIWAEDNAGNNGENTEEGGIKKWDERIFDIAPYTGFEPVPPSIKINTLPDQWFGFDTSLWKLDVDFEDYEDEEKKKKSFLDDGFYQIDTCEPDGWQPIFTDDPGWSFTEDFQIDQEIWNGLEDGPHTIYFMATDDAENATGDDCSYPLKVIKDSTGPDVSLKGESSGECLGKDPLREWVSCPAKVSMSCVDPAPGSGCDAASYRLYKMDEPSYCPEVPYEYYDDFGITTTLTGITSPTWVCAAAKDKAGNEGFSNPLVSPHMVQVDMVPPTCQISVNPSCVRTGETINLSIEGKDNIFVKSVEYHLLGPTGEIEGKHTCPGSPSYPYEPKPCSWNTSISISQKGNYSAWCGVTDIAGTVARGTSTLVLKVDGDAPKTIIEPDGTAEIAPQNPEWPEENEWVKDDVPFKLSCSDPIQSSCGPCKEVQYEEIGIDEVCPTPFLTNKEASATVEGIVKCALGEACERRICFHGQDTAGNWEDIRPSNPFKIDKKKPSTPKIVFPLSTAWQTAEFDVVVSNDYDEHSELDKCDFYVFDAEQGWALGSFVEDRPCNETFQVTVGSETSTFCQTEGANMCHVLVYSQDKAGNTGDVATRPFSISYTPPQVDEFTADPTILNIASPTSTFDWAVSTLGGAPLIKVELLKNRQVCKYEEVSGKAASGQFTDNPQESGTYEYQLHVFDQAGNEDTSDPIVITADYSRPETSIWCNGQECKEEWYNTNVGVSFTCQDNIDNIACDKTFWCQGEDCEPTTPYSEAIPLEEGMHYINFYSTDKAGNPEAVQSKTIKIDTTPPVVKVEGWPETCVNTDQTATLDCTDNLSGCNDVTYLLCIPECLDFGVSSANISSYSSVCAYAQDNAGNSAMSDSVVFPIDKTPPAIPAIVGFVVQPQQISLAQGTAFISWFVSDSGGCGLEQIEIRRAFEGNLPKTIFDSTGPFDSPNIDSGSYEDNQFDEGDGTYRYTLYVTDGAGNSKASDPIVVEVDKTPPFAAILAPEEHSVQIPPKFVPDLKAEFETRGPAELNKCEYKVKSKGIVTRLWTSMGTCAGTDPVSFTQDITVGEYDIFWEWRDCPEIGIDACTIFVRGTDDFGNVGDEVSRSFTIERTPDIEAPETSIQCNGQKCKCEEVDCLQPELGWYNKEDGDVEITLECTDNTTPVPSGCDKTYYCKESKTCTPTSTYIESEPPKITTEGTNYIRFYSIDKAGNEETPPSPQIVKLDKTPPEVEVGCLPEPCPTAWVNKDLTAKLICQDDTSGCNTAPSTFGLWIYWADEDVSYLPGTSSATIYKHALVLAYAQDNAGNKASGDSEFPVDKLAPTVDSFTADSGNSTDRYLVNIKHATTTFSWEVSDMGDSGLKQVELWRKEEGEKWGTKPYKTKAVSGDSDSGTFIDGFSGIETETTYEYGLRVVDNASNCIDESAEHCGGVESDDLDGFRIVWGFIKVTVDTIRPDKPECVWQGDIVNKSVTITCSPPEPEAVIRYTTDGSEPTSELFGYKEAFSQTFYSPTTVIVAAWDWAENRSKEPDNYFSLVVPECPPPDTYITSGPPDELIETPEIETTKKSATFEFYGDESPSPEYPTTYECQLDEWGWTACVSSKTYSDKTYPQLLDGEHTFYVRAANKPCGTDPSPAEYTWLIDSTDPEILEFEPDHDPVNIADSQLFLNWEVEDRGVGLSKVELFKEGSYYDSESISGVSKEGRFEDDFSDKEIEKTYEYKLRVEDKLGNYSEKTVEVEVDTIKPKVSCSPPEDPDVCGDEYTEAVSVVCTSEPGAVIYYTKDGTTPSDSSIRYIDPFTIAETTTLKVIAYDEANNPSDILKCPYIITAICLPPETFIDKGPSDPTNETSATFEFHCESVGVKLQQTCTFQCQRSREGIIVEPWAACFLPKRYDDLADGEHIFKVEATNACGETDASPDQWTWIVDTVPPEIIINTDSGQWFSTTSPLLDIDFKDDRALDAGFYRVDESGWMRIFAEHSGAEYTDDFYFDQTKWNGFLDGSTHKIYFKATDEAGNAAGADGTIFLQVKKDISLPETSIQCKTEDEWEQCSNDWYTADISVTLTCSDRPLPDNSGCENIYYCQGPLANLLEEPVKLCVPSGGKSTTFDINTNGQYYILYYSIDGAGNIEKSKPQIILLDKNKPEIMAFDMSSGNPKDSHVVNMLHPTAVAYWVVTDTGGSHLKQAELWQAPDSKGLPGAWSWAEIDEPPRSFIIPAPTSSDSWSILASPIPYPPPEGVWWFKLNVSDNAGNATEAEPLKLIVDRVFPFVTIISPAAGSNLGAALEPPLVDLEVEFEDIGLGLTECQYGFYNSIEFSNAFLSGELVTWDDFREWFSDNADLASMDCAGQGPVRQKEEITVDERDCQCYGLSTKTCSCSLIVQAQDLVDNWNFALTSFVFQLAPPAEAIPPETSLKCNGEECRDDWYNKDDGDVVITFECTDNTGPAPSGCDKTYLNGKEYTGPFPLTEGIHDFSFYSIDKVGNQEATKSQVVKLDKTPPEVGVPGGAPDTWVDTDQTATFTSCEDALSGCNPASYSLCIWWLAGDLKGNFFCSLGISTTTDAYSNIFAYAQDFAGNEGYSLPPVEFKVDQENPISEITYPPAHSWQKEEFWVQVIDYDKGGSGLDMAECKYSIGGEAQQARTCGFPTVSSFPVSVGSSGDCATEGIDTCSVSVFCKDILGHQGFDAKAYNIDYTPPQVGELSPTTAEIAVSQTYSASVSDNIEVAWCELYVDDVYQGLMDLSAIPCASCSASKDYTFYNESTSTMYAQCGDLAGNVAAGEPVTVEVSGVPPVDTTPPIVEVQGAPADWVNTDQIATLTCEDLGEGATGCNPATYGFVIIFPEGDYTIIPGSSAIISSHSYVYGYAQDYAGNTGYSPLTEFKIDKGLEPNTPSVSTLPVSQGDYCAAPLRPTFFWVFEDVNPEDTQSAYQVQIDDNPSFSSPINIKEESISPAYTHNEPTDLSYNTTYYWRVRVWDTYDGLVSEWVEGLPFTTPKHAYPEPNFSWIPENPIIDEEIQFTDETTFYAEPHPTNAWQWDFGDNATSTLQNPSHSYSEPGLYDITLIATDIDGYSCPLTKSGKDGLRISVILPEWEEIPPF